MNRALDLLFAALILTLGFGLQVGCSSISNQYCNQKLTCPSQHKCVNNWCITQKSAQELGDAGAKE